jgi:hypothetical protein
MLKSIVTLLLAAVGVHAVPSPQPAPQTLRLDDRGLPFAQSEQRNTRNLLLRAAGTHPEALEPGMVRIPIPVDGAVYEVIVVDPDSVAKLIPASRSNVH